MKTLLTILIALLFTGASHAQPAPSAFKTAQTINLLHSGRADVQKLFAKYEVSSFEDSDTFERAGIEVEVTYADGECSDDPASRDLAGIWAVISGKAVKVEISFEDPVKLELFAVDPSTLRREQEDDEDATSYVLFSKSRGIMFDIEEEGVERIILFPPAAKATSLCRENTWGKQFYASEKWFDEFQMGMTICVNQPAQVDDLELSSTLIEATGNKIIKAVTSATDPENDVLTYNYSISGGRILGTGHSVVWDLTGVPSGIYTITAGVDDGCGICGRTITKSITVR